MNLNRELLYRFFNRTTTLEEETQIRQWIEASDENRRELFRERKLFDAILLRDEQEQVGAKTRMELPWRKVMVAVSGIAAVVLLTMLLTVDYMKESFMNDSMNVIVVPQGQRVNLTLADGTNVWLNAKTRMEYSQSFAINELRTVKIDGEAYFEVSKNPDKPFVVQTSKGSVRVLGTKFYVTAYASTDKFETALMEGKVEVQVSGDNMTLQPNDKAVLINGKLQCRKIEDMDMYRWRDGLYCFNEQDFEKVLNQFEVYYDVCFVREDAHIPNPKITGKFRLVDGVEYALRVLQKEVQFTYRRDEESNIIYLK